SKIVAQAGAVAQAAVVLSRENRLPYHVYEKLAADAPEVSRARELQAVTAAGSLVSRAAFEALGGFDEGFADGYEDVDFCLRARRAGHRVLYEPRSTLVIMPLASRTTPQQRIANRDRLLARWKGFPL